MLTKDMMRFAFVSPRQEKEQRTREGTLVLVRTEDAISATSQDTYKISYFSLSASHIFHNEWQNKKEHQVTTPVMVYSSKTTPHIDEWSVYLARYHHSGEF